MSAKISTLSSFSARLCMMTTAAPVSATTAAMSGSFCRPHTSLMTTAPVSTARAATAALLVSMESGTSRMPANAVKTCSTRASSSAWVTEIAEGRVELSSDIHYVASGDDHALGMSDGGIESLKSAAIGERIRGQVQNSHDGRTGFQLLEKGVTLGARFGAHQVFSLVPPYSHRQRTATHLGCSLIHCAM